MNQNRKNQEMDNEINDDVFTAPELIRGHEEWMVKMSSKLTSDDRFFTFTASVVGHDYEVPFSGLRNSQGVLSWIAHLLTKGWFDKELLQYFLIQVDEVLGVNPHTGETRPTKIRKKIADGDCVRVVNPKKISGINKDKVFWATEVRTGGNKNLFIISHPGIEIDVMRDTDLDLVARPSESKP